MAATKLAIGSGSSIIVECCQICDSKELEQILFLGYLPPVNTMPKIGSIPGEQPAYPALLLRCQKCQLVQIGLIVDPKILFPPEYPYTSGTTKILRENFAELYRECSSIIPLKKEDLVVDIGSNDGTLLSNFAGNHRVHGIEPSNQGNLASSRGIPTLIAFFNMESAAKVRNSEGAAKIVTATNVFAHIEDVHSIVKGITSMLSDDGVFISESHYLHALIETLQYDTIYHEHLRHYSLQSIQYLLNMHNLEVFHAKRIPTHGGSIRVYASRKGKYPVRESVQQLISAEVKAEASAEGLSNLKNRVVISKLQLHSLLLDIKKKGQKVYGVGAPSRASTLINYVGLDDGILDCVLEVNNSYKVGKYIPGTTIPVLDESKLFSDQPAYALLLSWHIADELIPKLTQKGFKGDYIVPLPVPHIVKNS